MSGTSIIAKISMSLKYHSGIWWARGMRQIVKADWPTLKAKIETFRGKTVEEL